MTGSALAYMRSQKGEIMQKKLWNEMMDLLKDHVPIISLQGFV